MQAIDWFAQRIGSHEAAAIDVFWARFITNRGALEKALREGALEPAAELIAQARSRSALEIDCYVNPSEQGHVLVLAAPGAKGRILASAMIGRAPPLSGWTFADRRTPVSPDALANAIASRSGGVNQIAGWRLGESAGGLIDLEFVSGPGPLGPEARRDQALIAAWSALGERDFEDWIGYVVEAPPGAASEADYAPLAELRQRVSAWIAQAQAALPEHPHALTPPMAFAVKSVEIQLASEPKGQDFPGRQDMVSNAGVRLDVLDAYYGGHLFSSRRFSRHGEVFCYLKIDLSGERPLGLFADRSELEDQMHTLLRRAQAGAVIGGGIGHRYAYVDLALLDFSGAIERIQAKGRAMGLTARSWIQFFDIGLECLWIPIHEDAPAPPLDFPL